MTSVPSCQMCAFKSEDTVVYEDPTWIVRAVSRTPAVAGWLIVQARRHIAHVSELNSDEAASFGPLLQRVSHAVRTATGALRVYMGSLNDGTPHFHTHVLPRLPEMPANAIGWNAFGLSALAQRGEVRADPAEVRRVHEAVRQGLDPH